MAKSRPEESTGQGQLVGFGPASIAAPEGVSRVGRVTPVAAHGFCWSTLGGDSNVCPGVGD